MHNPFDRQLHAEGNINDFDDVMEQVSEVWKKVNPDCLFTEEESTGTTGENLTMPHVVYDLIERSHSERFSDGGKPRQMKVYPDPEHPGHNITELTEWFDCVAEFTIFGTTKLEAREWKRKLESFFLSYIGHFKMLGVQEIKFLKELNPKVSTTYRQDLPHRLLRYMVRIQRTQLIRSIRLAEIEVDAHSQTRPGIKERLPLAQKNEFLDLYDQTK